MGLTAIDAGVLVAFLDESDAFHAAAVEAILEASTGDLLLPVVAYSESMVGVLMTGATVAWFDSVLDGLRIQVGQIDRNVAGRAATLRALSLRDRRRRQWRMPDALIVADALHNGATVIITTDGRWPSLAEDVEVRVLAAFSR